MVSVVGHPLHPLLNNIERLFKTSFTTIFKTVVLCNMPYGKVMAKEGFMSTLYKNHTNLTIEVLD